MEVLIKINFDIMEMLTNPCKQVFPAERSVATARVGFQLLAQRVYGWLNQQKGFLPPSIIKNLQFSTKKPENTRRICGFIHTSFIKTARLL